MITIALDENAANTLADLLTPAMQRLPVSPGREWDETHQARLRASQTALFAGAKPAEHEGLLINSKQAAKMLNVSESTLWKMQATGEMPPPIRIGKAVRYSLNKPRAWVDEGCPAQSGGKNTGGS